ncbi:MAG: plasmid mobilization relaxosome protein MobC [Clostridia bacterium]|nr:plasmid mobilization relaxosome protein MobC [Clostridia bacterium]
MKNTPKASSRERTVTNGFLVTKAEDELIRKKMEAAGITNRSEFLRKMILNGYIVVTDQKELHECMRLMNNLGNNLRQIANAMRKRDLPDYGYMEEILQRYKDCCRVMIRIVDWMSDPVKHFNVHKQIQ